MKKDKPIIAFTVAITHREDDPEHCAYTEAYGMEMSVGGSWPVNALMMAPPHLITEMTQYAEITSRDIAAGASYTPGDGNYQNIVDSKGSWVLARPSDDCSKILEAGLGVLLDVNSLRDENLVPCLKNNDFNTENLILTFPATNSTSFHAKLKKLEGILAGSGLTNSTILVKAYMKDKNLSEYLKSDAISGFLFQDAPYHEILNLVETIF
ncbi:hypothetical protein OAE12_00485 [bacterium]|nr:hypothetical protein [bacterium]